MRRLFLTYAAAVSLCLAGSAVAKEFELDPAHTHLGFKILHAGTSYTHGRINNPQGTLVWDEDPSKATLEITAETKNIDTGNDKRDEHLRGDDFFSAKEFPTMSFKSSSFKKVDDKNYEVAGDLTIKGTTKPITLKLAYVGTSNIAQMGGERVGFGGVFTIKRSDYGINYMPQALGDDVEITVDLEAKIKK